MQDNGLDTHFDTRLFEDEDKGFLDNFDFDKLLSVIRKNIIWIIAILIITNALSYIFIRYTKPLFQATSQLKLEVNQEASSLGLVSFNDINYNSLSGEMELIRSSLFLERVARALNYDISFYAYGNILKEERYKNHPPPFSVDYEIVSETLFDRKIDVEILNSNQFRLTYYSAEEITDTYRFGQEITLPYGKLTLTLNSNYTPSGDNVKFYFTINSLRSIVSYLSASMEVAPLNLNANTIRISFSDQNPYKARDILTAIDTLYLEYSKEQKNQENEQRILFLDSQLKEIEDTLTYFEQFFENFTIINRTTDLDADLQRTIILINGLDSQRLNVNDQLYRVRDLKEQLQNETLLINQGIALDMPKQVQGAVIEITELLEQRDLMLVSSRESTSAVKELDQKVRISKSTAIALITEYEDKLNNRAQELVKQRKELENTFTSLPSKGTNYNKIRRTYSLYEQQYLLLQQKKTEFEISKAGTEPDFVILASPQLPRSPIYPKGLFIHGIGLMAGLILSFILIVIRYLLHNKITSQPELEHLSLAPLLGSVPFYSKEKMAVTRMVIPKNPKSALSEAFRSIRTNMDFLMPNKKKRIISVTSTISGEGKTFISVNLGGILALTRDKVVILDLDMRRPRIHEAFNLEPFNKGVSTILIEKHSITECIRNTEIENLDFIPAGPTPPNPSELILSDNLDKMLEQLKESYDVIILDTPPIGLVTDGLLAMKKADLPLYVVRADYSKKAFIKTLNKLIKGNRFKNLAVLLNSLRSSKNRGYGYGYGYYQGYYYDSVQPKRKKGVLKKILRKT